MERFGEKELPHERISPVDRIRKLLFPAVVSYLIGIGAFESEASAQTNPETRSTKEIAAAIPAEVARSGEEAKKLEKVILDHLPHTLVWTSPDSINGVEQEETFFVLINDAGDLKISALKKGAPRIEMFDRNQDGTIDEMRSVGHEGLDDNSSVPFSDRIVQYIISMSPMKKYQYQVQETRYGNFKDPLRYSGSLDTREVKSSTVHHGDNATFMVKGFQQAFKITLEKISKIITAEKK